MKKPWRCLAIVCGVTLLLPVLVQAASVDVSWDAVTKDIAEGDETVSYYMVYYGQTARPGNVQNPISDGTPYDYSVNVGNVTQTRIDDLESGQTYYFSIVAVDYGNNYSDYSSEIRYDVSSNGGGDPNGLNGGCGCATSSIDSSLWLLIFLGLWIRTRFRTQ